MFFTVQVIAQDNFTITPEKPKAGETITITYEPAGDLAGTIKPVEGIVFLTGSQGGNTEDLPMTRSNRKFTATVKTDTGHSLMVLGFKVDEKWDNNYNNGYMVVLHDENGKPKKGGNSFAANFYAGMGWLVGLDRNNEKAIESYDKEFALFPEQRKTFIVGYLRAVSQVKKDDVANMALKEIESINKQGLKEEADYSIVEALYNIAKLPEQAKFVASVKKEKFPKGSWTINETFNKFYAETDPDKKAVLLATIVNEVETNEKWKAYKENIAAYKLQMATAYAKKKDWAKVKDVIATSGATDAQLVSTYNSLAWEMQKTSENLDLAEEFSRKATEFSKKEITAPTAKKYPYSTTKQWAKERRGNYSIYADTYAMVLYRKGEYKKALPFAREAAITISEGKDPEQNNTYALVAEKTVPAKQLKKELEGFVKNGKSTGEMKDVLKRLYVKEKKSEAGFEDYVAQLQKENYIKMLAELRKSMLNNASPSFALLNLEGKKIDIADLKGKTVIVDFWATWCGPCKASFPGMQKMVNKYKDDPNVKFVFIDTWEKGDDKKKQALDFILNNKYTFDVLMDDEDKVVSQFKVDGIPTKFVIDRNGRIRFKSVGFDGSDDKLMQELTAMIELAQEESKKAF